MKNLDLELEVAFHFLVNNRMIVEHKTENDFVSCRVVQLRKKKAKAITPWVQCIDDMKAIRLAMQVAIQRVEVTVCKCGNQVKAKLAVLKARNTARFTSKCNVCGLKNVVMV